MLVGVNRSKGMLLLGLWVILSNLLPMLSLRIPSAAPTPRRPRIRTRAGLLLEKGAHDRG